MNLLVGRPVEGQYWYRSYRHFFTKSSRNLINGTGPCSRPIAEGPRQIPLFLWKNCFAQGFAFKYILKYHSKNRLFSPCG